MACLLRGHGFNLATIEANTLNLFDNCVKVELRMRAPLISLHAHGRDYSTARQHNWVDVSIGRAQFSNNDGFRMFAPNCWLHTFFGSMHGFPSLARFLAVAANFAGTTQLKPSEHHPMFSQHSTET